MSRLDLILAAFTFAAPLYLLLPLRRFNATSRLFVLVALVGTSFIPVDGLPLAMHLRGVIGDLAVTTMTMLLGAVAYRTFGTPPLGERHKVVPAVFFALLGLALYPATLGLSLVDPYRIGFEPDVLLLICGVATLVFCMLELWLPAVALILATLAYTVDFRLSTNYWDYILDPMLVTYSVAISIRALIARLAPRTSAAQQAPYAGEANEAA